MAEFITTKGTAYHIENIIRSARSKLVLVSPYLQLSKTFIERLKDASEKGVKVIIIYGKEDIKSTEKDLLSGLQNLDLYFFENLHAKCYFNEAQMVITSMNLYESSEKNNREMGVYIEKSKDSQIFTDAVNEVHSIIKSSKLIPLRKKENIEVEKPAFLKKIAIVIPKPVVGYCIRCEKSIPYNPDRPYCEDCFRTWAIFNNPDFQDKVCHQCGKNRPATMNHPICSDCKKQNQLSSKQNKKLFM